MPAIPYIPDITPLLMPREGFEKLLSKVGVRLVWKKSHGCPCTWGGPLPGSPDPQCQTCHGRGVYFDAGSNPFFGLLTWADRSPTPNEFGNVQDTKFGQLQHGEPTITIPFADGASGQIWQNASVYDAFVEVDAFDRFTADLVVSGVTAVPYQEGLTINAVTYYDTTTHQATPVSGYTVSGANVILPNTFPPLTPYIVEFTANPVFVAFRKAGSMPLVRPFGGNGIDNLPRRFRVQTLDLWARARQYPGETGPNAPV
jgi:hypothetical protein